MSNEIPEEWREYQISEVCEVVGGGTPMRVNPVYWNGDIPWASPTDITALSRRYITKTKECISDKGLAESSAKLLPAGTYMDRPALQGESLRVTKERLHTYIRPLLEAGKLPALMEFAAHFRPHQFNGLCRPPSPSGLWKCNCPPLLPSSHSIHATR